MSTFDHLATDLPRLSTLLDRGGRDAFLTRPIVLPDREWFPDVWAPDLESVRELILRLLAYAGLPELDAECGLLTAEREPQWLPESLRDGARVEHTVAGLFLGVEQDCAYFAIDEDELERPEDVGGVLAHEVAHAWRRVRGVDQPPTPDEEELTDITTIVLGLGVMAANHAYRYRTGGEQSGVLSRTWSSHRTAGYLGAERLAALLAVQCLVRDEDPRYYRKFLETTQRAVFDEVCRESDPEELRARLGVVPGDLEVEIETEPAEVISRPSRVSRLIERDVERVLAEARPAGGMLDPGLLLEYGPIEGRRHRLAAWGRPHRAGSWMRELDLVEAPTSACSLLVLTCISAASADSRALAVIPHETARRSSLLTTALLPWFEQTPLRVVCAGRIPSFVRGEGDGLLDVNDLGRLLSAALQRFDEGKLASEVAWLVRDDVRSWERVEEEAEGAPRTPGKSSDGRSILRTWWQHVSRPEIVEDESGTWNVLADPASIAGEEEMAAMQLLRTFAEEYTAAWCSQDPARVAAHFEPQGVLTINDGEPARGRAALIEVAAGFMATFPDLEVILDALEPLEEGVRYHWTLVGTHEGTGSRVRIQGHEDWRMGEDGRIAQSFGRFDAEEYERQIAEGFEEDD